jgi:glycosyltransferase involved in cell wall biosynthesis
MLIQAVHDLRREGLSINATIVGDGHAREEWEAKAHHLGVQDSVMFTGYLPRSDVPPHIAGFDVGYSGPARLATGNMYMSPIKIYEYLSMATPVVAAAYEDAQRLLEPQGIGYLFAPESLEDLKRSLRSAYADQGVALEKRGKAARTLIVRDHSWDARVRQLIKAVPRVLERTK